MIEKSYKNEELGIELKSFINKHQNIFLLVKMLLRFLVIVILHRLLENMLMMRINIKGASKRLGVYRLLQNIKLIFI